MLQFSISCSCQWALWCQNLRHTSCLRIHCMRQEDFESLGRIRTIHKPDAEHAWWFNQMHNIFWSSHAVVYLTSIQIIIWTSWMSHAVGYLRNKIVPTPLAMFKKNILGNSCLILKRWKFANLCTRPCPLIEIARIARSKLTWDCGLALDFLGT